MIKAAEKYIADVLSGRVKVSATTRLTFERHKRDLRVAIESGWYFDKKAVERVFDFCTLLKHSPDKNTWVPFAPEAWQAAIIYLIFGWHKKDGTRRFNYAYIEIPKKNGKTTFAAVFANYLLFFDGEEEAEVYCAATVEKQARLCFEMAKKMIEHSPALKKRTRVLTKNINIPASSSKMEMLGRDSESMEGINPSGAVIDEYHVWKNNEVFENIQSATVNRRQPLVIIITTSGRDKTLPCFGYRQICIDILKGILTQDDTFAIIYTPDETDDWHEEEAWKKANPNYGISVIPERFKGEYQGAVNDPHKEVSFKTKNLNIWVDAPEVWIQDDKWLKCTHGTTMSDLKGQVCYAGLDLASHVDINAFALFFPDVKGHQVIKVFYWIPQAKVNEKKDRVDYGTWVKKGIVKTTQGDVIDIDTQVKDIMEIIGDYQVERLSFDPAKAYHGTIQGLYKAGFPADKMDPYAQGIMNMSAPTKEFERLVMSGEMDHMNDPVLRWMLSNVQIYQDINNNIKPDKKRSREKIDGIVAVVTAIGGYMSTNNAADSKQIYNQGYSLRFV
jgi:phage terminase large subunit-like protein